MEEMNEKVVTVNIENYTGEKPIEVIIRKGDAAKAVDPLPEKEPLKCDLSGTIETPANWLEKRAGEFDCNAMYAVVDRENFSIGLVVNETDARNKRVIIGKAELSDIYEEFRINDTCGWEPQKLGQFIRLHRAFFDDNRVAADLVAKLKKFTANVQAKLEKSQDRNGSMQVAYEQTVNSTLPTEFKLNIPIFKGSEKCLIDVEIDHYIKGTDCYIQLFSPDALDVVENTSESILGKEVNRLTAAVPDIVIINGPLSSNGVK